MPLTPDVRSTVSAIVAWLDDAAATRLRTCVEHQDEAGARAVIEGAGLRVPAGFTLADPVWRDRLVDALESRDDEVDEDAATTRMPDYGELAAALRDETDE